MREEKWNTGTSSRKLMLSTSTRTLCILAALLFGALLGSYTPAELKSMLLQEVPAGIHASQQTVIPPAEDLHNNAAAVENGLPAAAPPSEPGIALVVSTSSKAIQPDGIALHANRGGIAGRKEKDVLVHLINAEAYGLSYKAKVAVGQVVMNRWKGPYYGDDLLAIMTAPHQFTPIYDGSAFQKPVEPDSIQAADAVLNGAGVSELTSDTYYFVNPDFTQDKTIERKMTFVCEIEGIHFFRPPTK